jgi:hypothetical protein
MFIRFRGKPFGEQLPSDSPDIVDMFTGRYQATVAVHSHRSATGLHATIFNPTNLKPKKNQLSCYFINFSMTCMCKPVAVEIQYVNEFCIF